MLGGMERRDDLGEFLRSRRARLRPEDAGLTAYGARRRVPGLRREELAQLAGVSAAYYTRLEQGQSGNASDAVLDALARVLRLDADEHAHLRNLARPRQARRRSAAKPEKVREPLRRLVHAVDRVPTILVGRFGHILAWNRLGHALFAPHYDFEATDRPADRPNCARLVFLDAHTRALYPDWTAKASDNVAYLRVAAGQYPDDPQLTELVGELTLKSREFAELWAAHPVRGKRHGTQHVRHPLVGAMSLEYESLHLPDDSCVLSTFTAAPGSPSESALTLLAGLTPPTRPEAVPAAVTPAGDPR